MERWPADAPHITTAVERLRTGAVIAFPTDTLYAVAARAGDPAAVRRLYEVKRRPSGQPMIWLVKDATQVDRVARVSPAAMALMAEYWPGPLTLVLPARDQSNEATIGFRAPDHPVALALLSQLDEPVASSSANRAGDPPPTDADQVAERLGDTVDVILDGGPCRIGQASTILDLSGPTPRILREGALKISLPL
ncbi:MAG TPA: L-threonylcarbamoyladenylate synthase [Candidatus Dormibacteraeota bacterium]|nr:L-threonylcarbamoyladenylate synthase [Candidatus Dormibacteraeota bacterium]